MGKVNEGHRRLVLVPCPFQGHVNPMLQLGKILHRRGFSITIAHPQLNFPDPSKHPDFTFLMLTDGFADNDKIPLHSMALISQLNTNCKASLQEPVAKMLQEKQQHKLCIIYDPVMYFAEEVARDLKLPSIILRTSSAADALFFTVFPQLLRDGRIPSEDSKSDDPVPGLHPFRIKDLHTSFFKNLLQLFEKVRTLKSSSAMIFNTVDYLEASPLEKLQQHYEIPLFPIGPLHKFSPSFSGSILQEDVRCITWLDKQTDSSVIYVSFGSVVSKNEKAVTEMAWGLANSQQPFLWVIRPGSINDSEWNELLPQGFKEAVGERGCIVKWAPQKEVLAHRAVGGFWSHCGWNSTMESISEGVPMICQPSHADQKLNARYLSSVWKIGFALDKDLERDQIQRAVKRLMVDREGKEMRQRAMDLKQKTELCVRKGGSSYDSLNKLVDCILSL